MNKLQRLIQAKKNFNDKNKSWRDKYGNTIHQYKGKYYKFNGKKLVEIYDNKNEYLNEILNE